MLIKNKSFTLTFRENINIGDYKMRTQKKSKFEKLFNEFLNTMSPCKQRYYKNNFCGAVKFGNKFVLLKKIKVQNSFRFYGHDKATSFKDFLAAIISDKSKMKYFKAANLSNVYFSQDMKLVNKVCVSPKNSILLDFYSCYPGALPMNETNYRDVTSEELNAYHEGIAFARAEFEKRLDAYLFENGISKLDFKTYRVCA